MGFEAKVFIEIAPKIGVTQNLGISG